MKKQTFKPFRRQNGYIVIITMVLLSALLVSSLSFFERATNNMQLTGYNRDSAESLLLAESAMNKLYGRYVYGDDIDGDDEPDINERFFDPAVADDPLTPLSYSFFLSSDGTNVRQGSPLILQRIANGEAIGSDGATVTPVKNIIDDTNIELRIKNLFVDGDIGPVVFTLVDDKEDASFNELVESLDTLDEWEDKLEDNAKIALAWVELVDNPNVSGTIQLYVQAMAIVGNSRSYVQRLIGSITTTLNNQATFTQAG